MVNRTQPYARSRWIRAATALYMPLSLILLLALWQLAIFLFRPPSYILPPLGSVLDALLQGFAPGLYAQGTGFLFHLAATLKATLGGLIVGSLLGLMIGIVCAEIRVLEKTLLNYVSALQTLPKVALAPLFLSWLGFGLVSKVAMSASLTFFPITLNTYTGLKNVDQERLTLMRSLQASRWQILWMVKVPSALPIIYASFKMALVYALLGAIVGEFVGTNAGMGMLIRNQSSMLDTAGVFTSLIVLGVVGFLMSALANKLEWFVIPWTRPNKSKIAD